MQQSHISSGKKLIDFEPPLRYNHVEDLDGSLVALVINSRCAVPVIRSDIVGAFSAEAGLLAEIRLNIGLEKR